MKSSNMGMFAIAAAIAFVGALAFGVPLVSLAPLLFLLACPLMMMFMMSGMHGGNHAASGNDSEARRDEMTDH